METKDWIKNNIRIIAFDATFKKVCVDTINDKIALINGEINESETPEYAAIRILKERTGLDVKHTMSVLSTTKNAYGDNVTTVVVSTYGNIQNKDKTLMMISKRQALALMEQKRIQDDAQLFLYMWYVRDLLD